VATVADFTAIEAVSRALQRVLTAALAAVASDVPPVAILHDLQPPPGGQPPVLTLFLYEVTEDHTMRNRDLQRKLEPFDGRERYRLTRPPLALELRYLVTAWANDRNTEHLMIGRTMQVLYERQVRRGADLDPQLDLPLLSITLAPLTLEERTRVWWAIQRPYRLSLNYEVRVVDVDVSGGDADLASPVRERQLDSVVPEGRR
jgi:Pvc16 N-terminal domain